MATMDISRYNELCRLCAAKTTVVLGVQIFQSDGIIGQLRKKIESCLPIQIHETDQLPKMVCENCLYKLNLLSEFRERAVRTERLLLDLFKEINGAKITHVPIEHDFMVQNQHLLTNHIDEIDLSQLGSREQLIVAHEIILTHQNVQMSGHSLDNIHLNQDMSNHNSILVQSGSEHEIETDRFARDNLDLIHHQQLLNDQFRLQHNLHVNISEANVTEIALTNELNTSVANCKLEQHEDSRFQLCNGQTTDRLDEPSTNQKLENLKLEDNSSNNSLLINEASSQIYVMQDESNTVQSVAEPDRDWFYCNICSKSFEDESSFEAHYETHYEKCNLCLAVFTNSEVLNSHRKEAHGDIELKPEIKTRLRRATLPIKGENSHSGESNNSDSGGDFENDQDDENENLSIVVPEKGTKKKAWSPKVCTECGKSYKTNYKLNEHMRKHTGEKPYKCDSCEKEFRSKIGLAQHAAKHTGKYDYACPLCGKGFQCKSYLMVHQRVHSDVKPYPCTTCGRNFKTKQSLLDHTNRHLGVKPYMCDICGRGFITKGLCRAHQKIHTGLDNRKYSCKVCNKMFVSKSYLQTHLKIHTGEKPFICEVCGKGFLTKVDLRIHTTMHTGEKSYVCEMCGKAFARRDALRCHRRSHTGERPYSCDLCGQTFTQFTPMAIHKRLHTGERPYSCESCGKAFVSRSTMMAHAKKHLRQSNQSQN